MGKEAPVTLFSDDAHNMSPIKEVDELPLVSNDKFEDMYQAFQEYYESLKGDVNYDIAFAMFMKDIENHSK